MTNLVPESEQQYGSILTVLGENAEQNGKLLNKQIEFTHIAFGDANDTYVQPDRKAQGLVNELHRIPVNSVDVLQATPDSVPILKVEAILPDDVNDVVIREFAAVATFNGQTYFHAIGNCARVYVPKPINNGNVSNPVTLEMTFVITSAEPIVEIDPNVITASREWVVKKQKDDKRYLLGGKCHYKDDHDNLEVGELLPSGARFTLINDAICEIEKPPGNDVIVTAIDDDEIFWEGGKTKYYANTGGYYRLNAATAVIRSLFDRITETVSIKDFGAVGDGITDDTAAFEMAFLASGGGCVLVPASEKGFRVKELRVPPGIKILGVGGDSSPFGSYSWQTGEKYDKGNKTASRIKVLSGDKGVICPWHENASGVHLENVLIEGDENGGAICGLSIQSTSVSTTNVSINMFPDGVGVEIGKHWRCCHNRLTIRNCGLGLHLNGDIGAINGVSWIGLMIEECAVGIYHTGAASGLPSIGNSFISPIIEAIRYRKGISFPSHVHLHQQFKDDTGMDESNVCAAVIVDTDAGFNFLSIYTEAVNGPHLWQNTNSKVLVQGGICEFDTNAAETWNGIRFDLYRGISTFNSVRFSYDKTKSDPLFRVNIFADFIFLGNKFSGKRNEREYYVDAYGNEGQEEAFTRGHYQEFDGQPIAIYPSQKVQGNIKAESLSCETKMHVPTGQNIDVNLDLSVAHESVHSFVSSIHDGNSYRLNLSYSDTSKIKNGFSLTFVHRVFTDKANSSVSVSFSDEFRAEPYQVQSSGRRNDVHVVTEFIWFDGAFRQKSQATTPL